MTNPIEALEALVEKWRIDGPIREYGQWQCAKQLEPILQSLREVIEQRHAEYAAHIHREQGRREAVEAEIRSLREERERLIRAHECCWHDGHGHGALGPCAETEREVANDDETLGNMAVAKDSDIPPNLEWYNGNIIDGDTNLTEDSDDRGPDPQRVDPELMRLMEPQFYSNPPTTGAVAKDSDIPEKEEA